MESREGCGMWSEGVIKKARLSDLYRLGRQQAEASH